jgi:DAACS family dicarboxylate/amino acid:cation (Na+ or H+) symporter
MSHSRILLGLVLGAVVGVAANAGLGPQHDVVVALNTWVCGPAGQVFLRLLFMVVVPLVFTSVVGGIGQIGDVSALGRIGVRTAAFFVGSTVVAAALALVVTVLVRPGDALDPSTKLELMKAFAGEASQKAAASKGIGGDGFGIQTLVDMVPKNPLKAAVDGDLVGILVFSVLFGIAATRIDSEKHARLMGVVDAISDVCTGLVRMALALAPLGVFALVFGVTSRFGLALLLPLFAYVAVVLGTLLLHALGVMSIVIVTMVGTSPLDFLRRTRASLLTAFSTSSSAATLPTNLHVAKHELGVPERIAGFVLPLGSTMCMNGTAIFEGITVLFLCQVFGVALTVPQMAVALVLCVVTAIGAAGVPGGSIPLLVGILVLFGVPAEGIAIVLGVDRLLDMARTTVNVWGDLIGTAVIARSEGVLTLPERPAARGA